jgi:demethylmenaquinone methyltransferase / 2-methoxy-6-polyprenyl-1,4-benzoquinol methylase
MSADVRPASAPRAAARTTPDKSPARIEAMFDAIAARYDFLNHLLSAGLDKRWRARAIRELALPDGARVVDLCTGTADLALAAVAAVPRARVVGIDFADAMLRLAIEKVRGKRLTNAIALVRGDAVAIPVADRRADAATIAFGIRNVAEPERALRELARVLVPGGRLAILELGEPVIPGIRGLYRWYFRQVLPRLGALVSKHESAYSYLPASVGAFPPPAEFAAVIARNGFENVRAVPLALGIVYLYVASRA